MNVYGLRIRIRPTRHEDLPFLQCLWNDGTVMRYKGYPQGMHVSDACMEKWWITTPQSQQSDIAQSTLASPHCLLELLDGTPIGELTYSLDAHERARVDLKLAHAYWEKGYATEALVVALREIFATHTVTRIIVEPTPDNARALKLYQRCGFHPAATENHPDRWECIRQDFAEREKLPLAEVA